MHSMAHVVRRRPVENVVEEEKDMEDMDRSNGPSYVTWVHVDQDYDGAWQRVKDTYPEFSEKLHQCRRAIINVSFTCTYISKHGLLTWHVDRYGVPSTAQQPAILSAWPTPAAFPEESLRSVIIKFPANESDKKGSKSERPLRQPPGLRSVRSGASFRPG